MKTVFKVLIGVAAAGVVYMATRPKMLNPWEKLAADVLNPNTTIGQSQRRYLDSVNLPYTNDNLLSHVGWAQRSPESASYKAYTAKPSWGINEVVPL